MDRSPTYCSVRWISSLPSITPFFHSFAMLASVMLPHKSIMAINPYRLRSEDRKRYGFIAMMDLCGNITLASMAKLWKNGVIDGNEEIQRTEQYVGDLSIKTPSVEQKVGNLSGGNQQKVVVGKWLMTHPKVLFLDEPTRGIDVGAKIEIYNIMNQLVEQGVCIVMISSELPEILGISDRILVMHMGRLVGDLSWKEATQEKVMYLATGGK